MQRIRKWLYRRGHRPKPGSIFYSPSLAFLYATNSDKVVEGFLAGMKLQRLHEVYEDREEDQL